MKKLAILAVAVLGTFAMANAQTTPAQAKETKTEKHDKKAEKKAEKKAKGEKKAETAKPEAPKAK